MADHSKIEWTDATWNIVTGCEIVSPGCTNCYAMKLAGTRLKTHPSRAGLTKPSRSGPVWTGEVRFNEKWLDLPLRWRKPRMIFVAAHGDLFHPGVPDEVLDKVFAVMAFARHHTFQVLTKRPERMREYLRGDGLVGGPMGRRERIFNQVGPLVEWRDFDVAFLAIRDGLALPNVWLGVSVEDQQRADERIPHLLATPAAKRFVSAEPLLGPVDLTRLTYDDVVRINALTGEGGWPVPHEVGGPALDWVIVGGESQAGARPMHPAWARSLRDQCAAAGVAFHFKQWGEWAEVPTLPRRDGDVTAWPDGSFGKGNANDKGGAGRTLRQIGKKAAGRLLDGRTHDEGPV